MSEGAFTVAYWAHAEGVIAGQEIGSAASRLTVGLARYRLYSAADCCCSAVKTPAEAATDPHVTARGVFERKSNISGWGVPALPPPIAPEFRSPAGSAGRAAASGGENTRFGVDSRKTE